MPSHRGMERITPQLDGEIGRFQAGSRHQPEVVADLAAAQDARDTVSRREVHPFSALRHAVKRFGTQHGEAFRRLPPQLGERVFGQEVFNVRDVVFAELFLEPSQVARTCDGDVLDDVARRPLTLGARDDDDDTRAHAYLAASSATRNTD
eukprot:CAMPEP_0197398896 /NCGR_PEP_ID=MMETSP1165-20131217/14213_1 /TAXON_ID=284809 /ORGANISM="Chrysocystis fragilis, Strain CCMP3189" /LENGTH=149 /DNA_ID=CAMNT_0042924867 /DNA_START=232 /DNA_END=679 /DNA_ORIENTATION=-